MAVADVASRAEGYGFPGVVVDGNDVLECYDAMRTAVDRARAGEGPTLIEAKTYRFLPHTSDDDDRSYRSREEVAQARDRDPIERFADYLRREGVLDEAGLSALRDRVQTDIDRDIAEAWNAADPEPESLMDHVFSRDERT
jgi:2-oxoisovalerate dehydrogenase E1 component alpha subunit